MNDNNKSDESLRSLIDIGITSSIASFISRCLLHPLDTIKSKLQVISSSNSITYNNLNNGNRLIVFKELYKGIGITALGGIPAGCLYFTSYHTIRNYCYNNELLFNNDIIIDLTSGLLAESISCILWVPIDVCKEQLQTQNELKITKFKNSFDALYNNNIKSLYKGYWATLASFGPFSALYFTFAQKYKSLLYNYINNTSITSSSTTTSSSSSSSSLSHNPTTTTTTTRYYVLPFHYNVLACSLAGACSSFITTPLDLVKLRLQVQRQRGGGGGGGGGGDGDGLYNYKSFIDGLYKLYKYDGGIKGMYKGSMLRMLFYAPNTALTMSIMEYLLTTITL